MTGKEITPRAPYRKQRNAIRREKGNFSIRLFPSPIISAEGQITYELFCRRSTCRYDGRKAATHVTSETARCGRCGTEYRIYFGTNATTRRDTTRATQEQRDAARREFLTRIAACQKLGITAQEVAQNPNLYFTEQKILEEIMGHDAESLHSEAHTPETIGQDLRSWRYEVYQSPADLNRETWG